MCFTPMCKSHTVDFTHISSLVHYFISSHLKISFMLLYPPYFISSVSFKKSALITLSFMFHKHTKHT